MFMRRDMNIRIKRETPWTEREIDELQKKYHIAGKRNWITFLYKKDENGKAILDEEGDPQEDETTIVFFVPGNYDQKDRYDREFTELSKGGTVIIEYKNFDWDDDSRNYGGIQIFENGQLISDTPEEFPDWRYASAPSSVWEV